MPDQFEDFCKRVDSINRQYLEGAITAEEMFNAVMAATVYSGLMVDTSDKPDVE